MNDAPNLDNNEHTNNYVRMLRYEEMSNYEASCLAIEILTAQLGSTETAYKWFQSKNRAFDLLTPDEMWIIDRNRVLKYLLDTLDR